jgi:hypothetical protein
MSGEGGRVERADEAIKRMSDQRDNPQNETPQPKPQSGDTVRREIDRIARQLEGLSKSLKRLKEAT